MGKFKTRARAVDLLGNQQIAGIPTAISELFKNAHDAYADNVVVDYFKSDGLFILRDDGLGMTKKEFENRWLTLGTESKSNTGNPDGLPPIDKNKKKRVIMGEKGIGRLAIAVIGPQVLILTRAKRKNKQLNIVGAFINWTLFKIPGINLEDIVIPIIEFPGGKIPNQDDVSEMVEVVRSNLDSLKNKVSQKLYKKISIELNLFKINPKELSETLENPSLAGEGTHFYINPSNESILNELEDNEKSDEFSKMKKMLLGFSNNLQLTKGNLLNTEFRYWENDNSFENIINEENFITPEEYEMADHHIVGNFDKSGNFSGKVTIYDEKPIDHVISWIDGDGKNTDCGPFSIKISHLQGVLKDSKLSREDHTRLNRKLGMVGGLYIYRDGFRILPYGDNDFDFLEIEKRRNLGASYYFFSHRRIFGTIEINAKDNPKLIEKAGREGFQQNKAYRDFKNILMNFLIQLAVDFFRKNATEGNFIDSKENIRKVKLEEEAKKKEEKYRKKQRAIFEIDLENILSILNSDNYKRDIENIINSVYENLKTNQKEMKIEISNLYFNNIEIEARSKLDSLQNKYRIDKPKGIGLTKDLSSLWDLYNNNSSILQNEIQGAINKIVDTIRIVSAETEHIFSEKKRILAIINETTKSTSNDLISDYRKTTQLLNKFQNSLNIYETSIRKDLDLIEKETIIKINTNQENLNQEKAEKELKIFLDRIMDFNNSTKNNLTEIQTQIGSLNFERDKKGDFISKLDGLAELDNELINLRERAELDLEMSQLGIAIEIINHEFNNNVKSIRSDLRQMKNWADINPEFNILYNNLRTNFEHLDGYLTLFTPLHRRLQRAKSEIIGNNIFKFLNDLFTKRLKDNEIEFLMTDSFANSKTIGFPATYFPVFVNLIDNSIFWLSRIQRNRKITLDYKNGNYYISDNGPGISARDKNPIFEMGFSRKPGGRGLGLFISRQVLIKDGGNLELIDGENEGATFVISTSRESKD